MRDNFSPLGRIFRADPDDEWGHPPSFSSSTNEFAHSEREREREGGKERDWSWKFHGALRELESTDNFFTLSFESIRRFDNYRACRRKERLIWINKLINHYSGRFTLVNSCFTSRRFPYREFLIWIMRRHRDRLDVTWTLERFLAAVSIWFPSSK